MNLGSRIATWFGGKKLPYARRLAYLESTGTQYVILPIITQNDHIICDFAGRGVSAFVFGYYDDYNTCAVAKAASSGKIILDQEVHSSRRINGPTFEKDKYRVEKPAGSYEFFVNGERYKGKAGLVYKTGVPILFGWHTKGVITPQPNIIFSFEIKDRIRLIPVMSYEGNPEMYDEVSGTFAERHGDFLYGELDGGGYKCLISSLKSLWRRFSCVLRNPSKEVRV